MFSGFFFIFACIIKKLFHERDQVGNKNPYLSPCRIAGQGIAVDGSVIKATGQSYAPYSKFHVGAAALLEDGTIVTGSNQRTPLISGLCAER